MAEIDSLTIRIQAETGSAVAQLKQIIQLVERLNTVANDKGWKSFTNGISRLGKASEKVEKLASALKGLQNMQVSPDLKKNFEKITTATDSLTGATKNISRFNSALKRLAKTGAESDQMGKTYGKLTSLLVGMSRGLSKANFQTVADGLKNLASAMGRIKKLGEDADLGKKFETVSQAVGTFANRLNSAVSDDVLARLERIATALKDIAQSSNAAGRAAKKFEKANQQKDANDVKAFAKAWQNVLKAVETVNKELSKIGSELYGSFESTGIIADLDSMTGAISKNIPVLGELTSAWKSAASQIKSIVLSNASVVDKASQIVLVRVSTLVRALYSIVKLPFSKAALGSTRGIISMISLPLKNLANNITDVTKRWKKFTSSLSRIAIYRLIRSALKEISKAMKEGVQNLYQWGMAWRNTYSSAAKFVDSMDRLSTAFLYLKNSIGAMVSPLIDTVAPVIDMLVDKFVALTNAINQAMAALSGAGVWRRALKYQYTYAEAANLTTKALKRTVLAFDELNKLDDPNKGGSGSDLDYSKMFEEVPVDDWLARILDSSSWRILGTGIANKINETLANLNWSSIKSSARIWARRFGSFLDGMFMGISMPLLGKSIAEGLNTMALSINTFFKEFHFTDLGKNIADGFTSMINNMEWDQIGRAMTQKWKAAFELIIGFSDVDLTGLGTGIVEMIANAIDNIPIKDFSKALMKLIPKLGTELGIIINGLFTSTNKAMNSIPFKKLGESFATGINNMFRGIDSEEAGTFLTNGLKAIIDFTTGALGKLNWDSLNEKLGGIITSIFKNIDLTQAVGNAVQIAERIVGVLTTIVNAIPWEEVGDAIASVDTTELKNGLKKLFENVVDGLKRAGVMDEVAGGLAAYFGLKLGGAFAKYLPSILIASSMSGSAASGGGLLASFGGLQGLLGMDMATVLGAGTFTEIAAYIGTGIVGALAAWFGGQKIGNMLGKWLFPDDAAYYENFHWFGDGGLFEASIDFAKMKAEDFGGFISTWTENFKTSHESLYLAVTNQNSLIGGSFGSLASVIQNDGNGAKLTIDSIREALSLWGTTWATEHPIISAGFEAIKTTVENSHIDTLWSGMMGGVLNTTNSILTTIEEKFGAAFNFITGGIKDIIGGANDLNDTLGKGVRTSDPGKITRRASGGTVDKGDLFLAGESGPEIVTSYGGESAVMNMEQIISSISASVAAASGGDIAIPIYLDGNMLDQIIVTAQQRQNIRSGGR